MNTQEKIAKEELLISQDQEILDNLRSYRLSGESGMYAGEINIEIARLENDMKKHLKVLSRLQTAA